MIERWGKMARRLTAPLVSLMLFLSLLAVSPVAADQPYTCADNSCAFVVPDSYAVASNDPSQIIFSDSVSGGVFSVAATDGSSYNSLDDAVNAIDAQNPSKDGYQAGPNNRTNGVLAGNPSTLIEYVANNSNGVLVESADFITLYQGKLYQLIFATIPANEDAFLASAQGVFNSWQFT